PTQGREQLPPSHLTPGLLAQGAEVGSQKAQVRLPRREIAPEFGELDVEIAGQSPGGKQDRHEQDDHEHHETAQRELDEPPHRAGADKPSLPVLGQPADLAQARTWVEKINAKLGAHTPLKASPNA